jgi:hypothetical protein
VTARMTEGVGDVPPLLSPMNRQEVTGDSSPSLHRRFSLVLAGQE